MIILVNWSIIFDPILPEGGRFESLDYPYKSYLSIFGLFGYGVQ